MCVSFRIGVVGVWGFKRRGQLKAPRAPRDGQRRLMESSGGLRFSQAFDGVEMLLGSHRGLRGGFGRVVVVRGSCHVYRAELHRFPCQSRLNVGSVSTE